jgi:hypothetical protein
MRWTYLYVPILVNNLGSDVDWSYSTVPQQGAKERKIPYPRGKVLLRHRFQYRFFYMWILVLILCSIFPGLGWLVSYKFYDEQ